MKPLHAALIVSVSVAALATACKKDDKKSTPVEKTPGSAKVTESSTPAADNKAGEAGDDKKDLMAAYKSCWAAFNAKDEETFGDCYDSNSEWSMVDVEPPMAGKGRDAAVASVKGIWEAFPDIQSQHQLVLHNGKKFAAVILTQGTNSGPFMGMPATNKKISIYETQLLSTSETGTVANALFLTDHSVMAHQLGMHTSERSADAETPWAEQKWITAENNETEKANVELVKSLTESIFKGDHESYLTHVADDISFRYIGDKNPMDGIESYKKGFEMWVAMADHKGEIVDVWAAGDWVVSVTDHVHTMKIDFPGAKGSKGKEVKTRSIDFLQINDGKLKTHWVFENSMAYAVQLGMMDMKKPGDGKAAMDKAP